MCRLEAQSDRPLQYSTFFWSITECIGRNETEDPTHNDPKNACMILNKSFHTLSSTTLLDKKKIMPKIIQSIDEVKSNYRALLTGAIQRHFWSG